MEDTGAKQLLITSYLNDFVCIGSDCEDSCCTGFNTISIDRDSYQRYQEFDQRSSSKFSIINNIKLQDESDFLKYAVIESEQDRYCPFLNEDKLCKIHLDYGHEALSHTCRSYPRIFNLVGSYYQLSASVSCPEIARLVLLKDDKLTFEVRSIADTGFQGTYVHSIPIERFQNPAMAESNFDNLQLQAIQVLQDRDFFVDDRMLLLVMWGYKVNELIQKGASAQIPDLQQEFESFRFSPEAHTTLKSIGGQPRDQLDLISKLFSAGFIHDHTGARFKACVDQFKQGLAYDSAEQNLVFDNYQNSYQAYFTPFVAEHMHVFENYLVNTAFNSLFPFGVFEDLFDNIVFFVLRYSLVRSLLIGMAAANKGLDLERDVLVLLQSYSKAYQNNELLLKNMVKDLRSQGFNSIAKLASLLKN